MNFIFTKEKDSVTIPPAALKLSMLTDAEKLELTTLDGVVILTKAKMTAMEYVKLLSALTSHIAQLMLTLREACGDCRQCEDDHCPYHEVSLKKLASPHVTVPDWAREEADIPADAKLACYVDEESGEITVCEADYEYDLSDVPLEILRALRDCGCCLPVLEGALQEDDIIYDK